MLNVHVRINDAGTGQPTPVRLRILDANGRIYPPLGHVADFAYGRNEDVGGHLYSGREQWFYVDGACEVPLPGDVPLLVEARKGPEYEPLRQEITLGIGKMALRLTINRWIDLRARGWYSGDTRCHFLSPHAALLESMAEDLAVTQLLATETLISCTDGNVRSAISTMAAFSGQQPCLERPGHVLAVNSFNTHPVLGSLALLHCHRTVFPLSFGGSNATDDWSLTDWCDQCHRKKGLVVWSDAFHVENPLAPEALACLILGRIDAVEVGPDNIRLREWYRAWATGIRFPIVGASSKDSNRTTLGSMRTFAGLKDEEPFTLAAWIDAVRAGRTFATSGPILDFSVNGAPPGSLIDQPNPGKAVTIKARLENLAPLKFPLEIIQDGASLARITPTTVEGGTCVATVEFDAKIDGPCWLAARCVGPGNSAFAHCSPVFVRVGGSMPVNAAASQQFADWLSRTMDWVDADGRFESLRRKEQLRAQFELARQRLLARPAGE